MISPFLIQVEQSIFKYLNFYHLNFSFLCVFNVFLNFYPFIHCINNVFMNIYSIGLSNYCFHLFNLIINLINFKAFIVIFIDFIYKFLH